MYKNISKKISDPIRTNVDKLAQSPTCTEKFHEVFENKLTLTKSLGPLLAKKNSY